MGKVKLIETPGQRRLHIGSYFTDLNESDYQELVKIFSSRSLPVTEQTPLSAEEFYKLSIGWPEGIKSEPQNLKSKADIMRAYALQQTASLQKQLEEEQSKFRQMVEIWKDVDEYSRNHPDIKLGESVSVHALKLMKQLEELKQHDESRTAWIDNALITMAEAEKQVKSKDQELKRREWNLKTAKRPMI